MTSAEARFNPFPGLRPFEPDEDHLFFGREQETDELLRRLRVNRFLSIVGTSGCGKSSLIRCGVVPSLHSGMMARAGSSWRVSILRPGEDPIGHLATALDAPDVIGAIDENLASTNRVLIDAALRRGPRGLVDAVRHARIPPHDNLLVVVDQFEELFRFERSRRTSHGSDDAAQFVRLLLEAAGQNDLPIYVAITMRSDFIGDCIEFPGLAEALNAGQYLVPRMARDALRSAITGPAAVAGGQIASRLVRRLLNDLGSDQDQLPVLQHALMRTWEHWDTRGRISDAVDIEDYEAVGTLRDALSRHAEEAYAESALVSGLTTERVFKALVDTVTEPRGTRRPCTVAELAAVAEDSLENVIRIVELFRRPGRSFLMPPADVPLDAGTIVDLSHESLMRCWTRLIRWADEERLSGTMYLRVARAAAWHDEGSAGLWRDPELELGLRWRHENRPTAAWAQRYGDSFERAMRFLDSSRQERDRLIAERRAEKRRQWRQLQWTAVSLAVLLLAAGTMAVVASRQSARARAENARAEDNLRLARAAVDQSLIAGEVEPSRLAADFPEFVAFRQELLQQAQRFYREFVNQAPTNAEIRAELAFANLRLAHIDRALASRQEAVSKYREAIARFESLVRDAPDRPDYRRALADTYNWLGETMRMSGDDELPAARDVYDRAQRLQEELVRASPDARDYRRDLARTRYNRGILLAQYIDRDDTAFAMSETDFREAIRLLEPLGASGGNAAASQELGRAYNNIGSLLAGRSDRASEAREMYTRAVQIHEALVKQDPGNREYALELVKFYNNLADLHREAGEPGPAAARNSQALSLVERLARPAPSLSVERADSHSLRGRILQTAAPLDALAEYRQAFGMYQTLAASEQATRLPDFHVRFGDLLVNLSSLVLERREVPGTQAVLSDALNFYLDLARRSAAAGTPGEARSVLNTFAAVLPVLPEPERQFAAPAFQELEPRLRSAAGSQS